MSGLILWIQKYAHINSDLQIKFLSSAIIIIILWFVRFIVLKMVWRHTEDVRVRYNWRKGLTYLAVIICIFLVGRIWLKGIESIATFLGLLTAGIAIALKDIVANFAGWIFIVWRRPFSIGDRIQIGDCCGDVIDIRLFQFTLLEIGNWVHADQSTGRIIHIPNGMILSRVLANYSKGFQFIWNEIPILVTFESDWKEAKSILREIASKHAEHFSKSAGEKIKQANKKLLISYTNLKPTVYTGIKDSGVMLTIRYLIGPRKRRNSEQQILEEILEEFSKHNDIDFAYPTQRYYDNLTEGKQKDNK